MAGHDGTCIFGRLSISTGITLDAGEALAPGVLPILYFAKESRRVDSSAELGTRVKGRRLPIMKHMKGSDMKGSGWVAMLIVGS